MIPGRNADLQDLRAALADDDCVCVREDGGDGEATRALDIHEERAGGGHELLELVLAGLTAQVLAGCQGHRFRICIRSGAGVEEIDGENLESCQPTAPIKMGFAQRKMAACEVWWQSPTVVCPCSGTSSHPGSGYHSPY
jgi:hypothetical protein